MKEPAPTLIPQAACPGGRPFPSPRAGRMRPGSVGGRALGPAGGGGGGGGSSCALARGMLWCGADRLLAGLLPLPRRLGHV